MSTLTMTDEQASDERVDLREVIAAARRRLKPMLITAGVCLAVTLLVALLWPARFRSTATILIEQQELPADLVRSTVTSYADQRIQVISQRVMTTQNLLDIIRRYDLYPRERQRETRETLIQQMRDDIDFKMISADVIDPRSGMPREATIAFTVSYTSTSPAAAVKIANELTTLYLNENLTERTRLATNASAFLESEGERLSKLITELENQLAEFKQQNIEQLPELAPLNFQLLESTERDLRDAEMRRSALEQQRVFLEAQLAQLKPNTQIMSDSGERILSPADRLKSLRSQLASARALYAADHPDIQRLSQEIAGLESQTESAPPTNDLLRKLEEARGKLGQARQKYAADHPDVQRYEREVVQLEAQLAGLPSTPRTAKTGSDTPDNPAYIQIGAQLEATRGDQRALAEQMDRLRTQIAQYQHKLAASPQIEKEYRELARDYENAKVKYQEIRAKYLEAQVAQNLEADRKGERFTLIEPPLPPEEPVSPNRPVILVIGVLLSLALAGGIAALLEKLDATVRGRKDLIDAFSAPPLAIIPRILTERDYRAAKRRVRFATAGIAATGVAAITTLHFAYRPLDILWFLVLRRLGL